MCRIVGFFNIENNKTSNEELLISMRDTLSHGGPDDAGQYIDDYVSLGHRRLSILDLSPAGHQPMYWQRYVIVYNGEVYNYKEIQKELIKLGYSFTTGTDTEVILKSYHEWGKDCVQRFRGMFAFAIWDKQEQKLILCRDRVGVKPLFWYKKDSLFMFASELKAFHKHERFDKTIDKKSVGLYLQQGYIQSPHCIFKYVQKLEPGTFLEITPDKDIVKTTYWDIEEIHKTTKLQHDEEELTERLEDILLESFKLRMVADVPVGMFLSGGIDSSLVTAMLQKSSNIPLNTFTIGFEDKDKNEAIYAAAVAKHIGANHTELICGSNDFKDIIGELPSFYDEPFGDSSAIPTYLVSKLARESVTVSLSADGGDELFGGYTKYEITKNVYAKLDRVPSFVRKFGSEILQFVDTDWIDRNSHRIPILKNYKDVGNKFNKFQQSIKSSSILEFFNASSSFINQREIKDYTNNFYNRYPSKISNPSSSSNNIISFLGMLDIKTYLEGDIMTKVDRATMQVALEGREPFLDHKIIEFSQSIPDAYKIKNNDTKYLLRKILYKHVPKELIERPKQGFSIPIETWLHTHLKKDFLLMLEDGVFFNELGLNWSKIREEVNHFYNKSAYVNPNKIWIIYSLLKWYTKWK